MKRKTSELPTRNWKFGAFEPSSQRVRDVLHAKHRLFNKFVEVEHRRRGEFKAIRREYAPELARVEEQIEACYERLSDLTAEAKRERRDWFAEHGEKVRSLPPEYRDRETEIKAMIGALGKASKADRDTFNALRAPGRDELKRRSEEYAAGGATHIKRAARIKAREEMMSEPEWHDAWKRIEISDTRAHDEHNTVRAGPSSGLLEGDYNGVDVSFQQAVKDRRPLPPKFKRWHPNGNITIALRGGTTWADLHGNHTQLQVRPAPPPGRRRDGSQRRSSVAMRIARMRVDSAPDRSPIWADVLVRFHREPPADASVRIARLLRRKVGERMEWSLVLTLEHASFAEPQRPAGVGDGGHVRIGWGATRDGARVAALENGSDVIVPDSILEQEAHAAMIRGFADKHYADAKRVVRLLLGVRPGFDRLLGERSRQMFRSVCLGAAQNTFGKATLHELWLDWTRERLDRNLNLFARLDVADRWIAARGWRDVESRVLWWLYLWTRKDAHLRQYEADSSRRFTARRDAFFRGEAIRIATQYECVTIDNYSIAALKKQPDLSMPGEFSPERARRNLQRAAPGRFREILLEVMGPRCTPCERPGGAEKPRASRKAKTPRKLPELAAAE